MGRHLVGTHRGIDTVPFDRKYRLLESVSFVPIHPPRSSVMISPVDSRYWSLSRLAWSAWCATARAAWFRSMERKAGLSSLVGESMRAAASGGSHGLEGCVQGGTALGNLARVRHRRA